MNKKTHFALEWKVLLFCFYLLFLRLEEIHPFCKLVCLVSMTAFCPLAVKSILLLMLQLMFKLLNTEAS